MASTIIILCVRARLPLFNRAQASLLGSVFSNMLLVLGCCFLFGGLKHKEQRFNSTSAIANMSLLLLSSMALILPTPLSHATVSWTSALIVFCPPQKITPRFGLAVHDLTPCDVVRTARCGQWGLDLDILRGEEARRLVVSSCS